MRTLPALFWLILNCLIPNVSGADIDVTCVFMESCILPCSFSSGAEGIIHWRHTAGDRNVHSYYQNQDQLANQDQRFRGRTSLFLDQVSGGNASLRLTGLMVQDQGRYSCYTSTISGSTESFINLKVNAPVSKIHIEQVGNRISCSSDGIYPEPELTWSSNPPSRTSLSSSNATVQQTKQLLYSISSSLTRPDAPDVDYSCTISTSTNWRRATVRNLGSISGSGSDTVLPCTNSSSTLIGLIWRFNHSHIILNQTSISHTVSEQWKQHVKNVSESGSLTLQNLSSDQEGLYSCEGRSTEETQITNTFLRLNKGQGNATIVGIIVVVVILVLAAVTGLVLYWRKAKTT